MARRNVILLLVEGISEETALGKIFKDLFNPGNTEIEVLRTDITSDKASTPQNLKKKVTDFVSRFAERNFFRQSDFLKVIHIVDTDGTYIAPEYIIEDASHNKPFYELHAIRTADKNGIIMRNENKRRNMNFLSTLSLVWGKIPYKAYYMSCNLEHVLVDKQNCTDEEKEEYSYAFAEKYEDNAADFVNFIGQSEFSVQGDFAETWNYIKQGLHSLERHTNLGLIFNENA